MQGSAAVSACGTLVPREAFHSARVSSLWSSCDGLDVWGGIRVHSKAGIDSEIAQTYDKRRVFGRCSISLLEGLQ